MNTIGIICEFNPFHNGHIYLIDKIKEKYKDSTIICVMSGNFTQRGDISLINKWDKTKVCLNHNIDLVVELPTYFCAQSADVFSYSAIKILKELKVEKIIFGSESDNVDDLAILAKAQLKKEYKKYIKEELKKGINYPTALNNSLSKMNLKKVNEPNDILALSYIREIISQKANISYESIKRTNSYHDKKLNGKITSASSIRENINKNIKKYIPKDEYKYLKNVKTNDDYFPYLKYKIISEDSLKDYLEVSEGIDNKIKKEICNSNSLDELILNVKSKRYTYSKIKRILLHILLGIKKEDKDITYIRILGFNDKGRKYLNKIKKDCNLKIYSSFNKELNDELKYTSIYSVVYNDIKRKELLDKEIKEIIKR